MGAGFAIAVFRSAANMYGSIVEIPQYTRTQTFHQQEDHLKLRYGCIIEVYGVPADRLIVEFTNDGGQRERMTYLKTQVRVIRGTSI